MRTAQLTERPIYIPKGRRELVQGQSTTTPTLFVKTPTAKRPMTDQTETQNKAARCAQQENDVSLPVKPSPSISETKAASQKAAFAGIYIPKAKREQMEKDAATAAQAAAALKQRDPSYSKSFTKAVQTTERPTSAHVVNKGTLNSKPSTTSAVAVPQKETAITNNAPQTEKLADSSNNTISSSSKPKETVRGAVYVPRGRRELNEKKAVDLPIPPAEPILNDSTSKGISLPTPPGANVGISVGVSLPSQKPKVVESSGRASPPRSKTYSSWDDSSDDETSNNNSNNTTKVPSSVSIEDTIQQCTLVLSGVPTDMSDLARSNITRAYGDKGATIKWTSSNECLLMFKNERAAMQMVPAASASIFRVVRLLDMSGAQKEELMAAARDNFVVSKPERDSTVANRLIGAALGIRLPRNLTTNSHIAATKRAPSPVREDAWD